MDASIGGAIRTLAWYNRPANESLGSILSEHEALAMLPDTTWYGSVLALLCHIAISDTVWLNRTCPASVARPSRLDLRFDTVGERVRQPRWQLLLHMFNHETHHRGAISQFLDEHDVANDYSNLVYYLRDDQRS
ncbi:MAG: DinB family protein [Spirochaetota bacterium]